MKKKIIIYLLVILGIFTITGCSKEEQYETFDMVYDVTYVSEDEDACLTFYKNGKYSLYDCDSEPTDYFFDSESECTYTYTNGYMNFKCKYKDSKYKDSKIRILNWNEEEFKFVYDNKEVTFKKSY